jgi:hypothetical protein
VRAFGAFSVRGAHDEVTCWVRSRPRVFDGEELPWVRDAFKRAGAAIGKGDAGAADEVGDGTGDEDFVGLGVRLHALGDVDGDAADIVTVEFDLAGVQPYSYMDADGAHGVADGTGAAHSSAGPVKDGQEPVARGFDLSTPEAFEFGAGQAVVCG